MSSSTPYCRAATASTSSQLLEISTKKMHHSEAILIRPPNPTPDQLRKPHPKIPPPRPFTSELTPKPPRNPPSPHNPAKPTHKPIYILKKNSPFLIILAKSNHITLHNHTHTPNNPNPHKNREAETYTTYNLAVELVKTSGSTMASITTRNKK